MDTTNRPNQQQVQEGTTRRGLVDRKIWHRLLGSGEVTLKGDEYLVEDDWLPVEGSWLGKPAGHLPGPVCRVPAVVRRHINPCVRELLEASKPMLAPGAVNIVDARRFAAAVAAFGEVDEERECEE